MSLVKSVLRLLIFTSMCAVCVWRRPRVKVGRDGHNGHQSWLLINALAWAGSRVAHTKKVGLMDDLSQLLAARALIQRHQRHRAATNRCPPAAHQQTAREGGKHMIATLVKAGSQPRRLDPFCRRPDRRAERLVASAFSPPSPVVLCRHDGRRKISQVGFAHGDLTKFPLPRDEVDDLGYDGASRLRGDLHVCSLLDDCLDAWEKANVVHGPRLAAPFPVPQRSPP